MLRASTNAHLPARGLKLPSHCRIYVPLSAGFLVHCEARKPMAAVGHPYREVDTLLFDLRVNFLVRLFHWEGIEIDRVRDGRASSVPRWIHLILNPSIVRRGRREDEPSCRDTASDAIPCPARRMT